MRNTDKSDYVVQGRVTDGNDRRLAKVLVKAYDRDIRSLTLLGECLTDSKGEYKIVYSADMVKSGEKQSADLSVQVFGPQGKNLYYESGLDGTVFNASDRETIDITINGSMPAEENEFELVLGEVNPLLDKVPLTGLQENEKNRDVTFLSRETGIAVEKIGHLSVAHSLAALTKADADFFYALLRKNTLLRNDITKAFNVRFFIDLNTDLNVLLFDASLLDPTAVKADVASAHKENLVPNRTPRNWKKNFELLSMFKPKAEDYYRTEFPRKVLAVLGSLIENDKITQIAKILSENKQDLDTSFKQIADPNFLAPGAKPIDARLTAELAQILGFDEGLLDEVRKSQKIGKPEDMKKLAAMNKADWKELLANVASKAMVAGQSVDNKVLDFHASTLVRKMEKEFPSVAFAAQLQREKNRVFENQNSLKSLFAEHAEFDLAKTNIDLFVKKERLATQENEGMRRELKSIQRVFKLIPHYGKTNALLKKNIHSAQGITALGQARFLKEIAPAAGLTTKEATDIYRKAERVNTAAMLVAGDLQDAMNGAEVAALGMNTLSLKLAEVGNDFPNLKSLFKMTDSCACEHCRSVYSPAAYLVELLQFLNKRVVSDLTVTPHGVSNAKDTLFDRRPDLGDIDLSCENANTPVPYIDLVCELLEEAVTPDPGFAYTGPLSDGANPLLGKISNALFTAIQTARIPITPNALVHETETSVGSAANLPHYVRDKESVCKAIRTGPNQYRIFRLRQTLWPADELAAAPAYVNTAAYAELSNKSFAFKLPFDLVHAEAKAYFSRFDIKRHELMADLQSAGVPDAKSIAAEHLGLNDAERSLIVTPKPANQQDYWNTAAADAANELKVVSKFLDKTGLTYKELVLFLKLKFIDPTKKLFIKHLDLTCDTAQKEIANLSNKVLDRIHRFLRLQKKTKWSFETLDEIISQQRLGNGTLDDACLIKAATLLKISEISGIKLDELTGFYRFLPHVELSEDGKKPLYHQVFLNKAKNGFIEEGLAVDKVSAGTQLLVNLQKSIAVGLQLSEKDLDKLLPPATFLPSGSVSFENLSRLFAAARLIKKLRLKAEDFVILTQLTAIDVTESPEKTLEFIEKAKEATKFPLKLADLTFMIRHESENPPLIDLEIKDDKIKQILEQLQIAYKKAQTANASPFAPIPPAIEQKEALANSLAKLNGMSEQDVKDFAGFIETVTSPAAATAANASVDAKLADFFSTADIKARITTLGATPPATDAPSAAALASAQLNVVKAFLNAISRYLYFEVTGILTQTISATFKADMEMTAAVLNNAKLKQPAPGTAALGDVLRQDIVLTASPISPAACPQQYDAVRLLHKLFPLIKSFKLTPDTAEWHLKNNQSLGWFELDRIPYKTGQAAAGFSTYADFKKILDIAKQLTPVPNPADAENPITFYTLADMLLAATLRNSWIEAFSVLAGYDKTDIDAIDAHLFPVFTLNNYRNPKTWESVDKCARHLRTLGVTLAQAKEFVKPVLVAADAAAARMALKARYDEDTWLSTLKEIMDAIRPQKRNALVAYLLATNANLKDENGLFDHFLVDVEMESCMPSSRIVQAHGTIQLFAQRCLMGLEPKSAANLTDDPNWEQWKWMKNYRVWEANRKVFLYPENWIEAELRDDKSFLFKELENELLQNELNDYNSEQALIRYLEKLDDIAFLEVMATWYQVNIRTMHVFARTKGGDPAIYYYRRFEKEQYWTPWEKVDLDISGDHLLAFMRNNRLCLVWPVFTEEPDPDVKSTVPNIDDPGEKSTDKPRRKLKIQIAISELANSIWQPKRVSKDAITTPDAYTTAPLPVNDYTFTYVPAFDQIWLIKNNGDGEYDHYHLSGIFEVAGCKGYPELLKPWKELYLNDFYPDFKDTALRAQKYKEQNADSVDDLAVRHGFHLYDYGTLLQNTPGKFRITYPHQFTEIDLFMLILQLLFNHVSSTLFDNRRLKWPVGTFLPYFMEDSKHAYVIIPGAYKTKVDERTGERDFELKRTAYNFFDTLDTRNALAILNELIVWFWHYGERFMNMYHPLVCPLKTTLYKHGIPKLMDRDTQLQKSSFDFAAITQYHPTPSVPEPRPVEDIDFQSDGSYSSYNWEMFFHVPFLLATRLTKNQRFEEAMTWFHYIFNPTGALNGDAPQKYWVTKPFYLTHDSDYINQRIDTLLYNVSNPATPAIKTELEFAIDEWRTKPFKPHVVARFRTVAYQKAVLMKYIDMLTEWGDFLFRQDTMESIAQATQMYILADKLLGPKPRIVPPAVKPPSETYNQIEEKIDAFGNALIDLENILPDLTATPEGGEDLPPPPPAPATLSTLYFCVPQNGQMLAYWDRIADRLFKIRHCQNIDGIERSLALFAPPIDPGMLVRAAASGLDLSAVLGGLNAPAPYYRFNVLSQKASELIQEVRGLGSALLVALEKKDAEAMALLRSELEIKVLKAVRDMKTLQIKEAKEQINILNRTKIVTEERKKYYQDIEKIIPNEQLNLDKLSEAQDLQFQSQIVRTVAGALALIPEFHVGANGFGGSPEVVMQLGGSALSKATAIGADILNILSGVASFEANRASILGGYDRRFDDWKLQERLATKELVQIDRQIVAAEIRKEIAETDLKNHDLQIENSEKTDEFMRSKFTNKELYDWMIGQISSVYFRAYQLAFDMAKKAERSYKFELGNDDSFIGFGYWDSMKKGLQSADMLFHDLKRMETSYLDKNKREYEITKHVSLSMLDPLALAQLRATGACNFEIPEAIYDMDHPGQYFRRVKSVSLSLPCIAGPYTSVSAKLSLVSNRYRKNSNPDNAATGYAEDPGNDPRFVYNVGSIQSIAASNSQNDSGMFELNFRDERYLPFEGCGAIGTWRLELPADVRQFDYETIADAIVHVRYTAREGGSSLKNVAASALKQQLLVIKQQLSQAGLHLAIDMKHEMPNEWNLLKQVATVQLTLDKTRLPYFVQSLDATIENVIFLAKVKNNPANFAITVDGAAPTNLSRIDAWKLCRGDNANIEIDTQFAIAVAEGDIGNLEDLMIVAKYEFPV